MVKREVRAAEATLADTRAAKMRFRSDAEECECGGPYPHIVAHCGTEYRTPCPLCKSRKHALEDCARNEDVSREDWFKYTMEDTRPLHMRLWDSASDPTVAAAIRTFAAVRGVL